MSAVADNRTRPAARADRSGRLRRRPRLASAQSLVPLVVGLGIWELVGRTFLSGSIFFVPFSMAVESIYTGMLHGTLLHDLGVSAFEMVVGFAVAVVIGISVGAAMGLSERIRSALIFWVDVFNATPVLALAPLFILMLGIGISSKIAFIAFVAVWTILLNTMTGFMHPDRGALEMVRSFGGSSWDAFRIVRVPFAIPTVAVGLRLGIGRAAVGVVVGELFGSNAGLGYRLFAAKDQFDTAGIFAAVIMLAVLALVAINIMTLVERRLSSWR